MSSETSGYLVVFGVLTMLLGLISYLTHPENVMLALIFGGVLGVMLVSCGLLGFKGHRWIRCVALLAAGGLGLACIWRASLGWHAVANGQKERAFAAFVVTIMLAVSAFITWRLLRDGKRVTSKAGGRQTS